MKKKINYLYAALVFIAVMCLMNGLSYFWSFLAMIEGMLLRGEQGVDIVYTFLMDHMNFYSVMIYLPVAFLFGIWFYLTVLLKEGTGVYLRKSTKRVSLACFGWTFLLTLAMQHATSLIFLLFQLISPEALSDYNDLVEGSSMMQYSLLWVFSTLILPPLAEEIIFRGLIMKYLQRAGAAFVVANLIQAVLFGIFLYNLTGTVLVDFENAFLPDWAFVILMFFSVPVLAVSLLMIHFGIGDKKKKERVR